jgi:hypothetical protein
MNVPSTIGFDLIRERKLSGIGLQPARDFSPAATGPGPSRCRLNHIECNLAVTVLVGRSRAEPHIFG